MSDSVQPHRWQSTTLRHPWDSPGKNTRVGCHFLLQSMKVKSEREGTQSCPTLSNPMGWSLSGSSVHGIFQARVLEWGAIAFSRQERTVWKKLWNSKSTWMKVETGNSFEDRKKWIQTQLNFAWNWQMWSFGWQWVTRKRN